MQWNTFTHNLPNQYDAYANDDLLQQLQVSLFYFLYPTGSI